MRKIKAFKLTLRAHDVKRRAKKERLDLDAAGLPDLVLNAFLERTSRAIVPGVLFETFGHPDIDQELLSPISGLAYTLILATLGENFSSLIQNEPAVPAEMWPILQDHALDEAIRFASGLVADDAEKDACELSPLTKLSSPEALNAALNKLDASNKLGVSLVDGELSPRPALIVSQSWLAKSKSKGRK